jgi:hypothetical protein
MSFKAQKSPISHCGRRAALFQKPKRHVLRLLAADGGDLVVDVRVLRPGRELPPLLGERFVL